MVTKHEITKAYSIQMTCDLCGYVMLQGKFDSKSWTYKSTCPKCGNVVDTGDVCYPYMSYEYKCPGEVISDE